MWATSVQNANSYSKFVECDETTSYIGVDDLVFDRYTDYYCTGKFDRYVDYYCT